MKNLLSLFLCLFVFFPLILLAQDYTKTEGKIKVFIVKNRSEGPATMERSGLLDRLTNLGCDVANVSTVRLTPEEEKEYGEWNQDALESKHL